jgi:hypothetical protein
VTQPTTITLDHVRAALRMTHTADDVNLQRLLDSATQECLRYLGRSQLPTLPYELPVIEYSSEFSALDSSSEALSEEVPSSEDPVAPDVVNGILLLVQADYEGDLAKREDFRRAATSLWAPYRIGLGV